jgi:hypothetical protein
MGVDMKDIFDSTAVLSSIDRTNDRLYVFDDSADELKESALDHVQTALVASATDVLTGTSVAVNVTPDALAALWEQGSNIASAETISIGEGGYFNVTGTTTITDIDFATDKAGRFAWLKFAGILILTNGANLILPTGADITTAAGDTALVISEGSDVVRLISYQRVDGTPLVGGGGGGGGNITADVYIANVTQTGTAAPIATVGDNTLGGTVVWTRTGVGTYEGTLAGAFAGTTVITLSYDYFGSAFAIRATKASSNVIQLYSYDFDTTPIDIDGGTVGLAVFVY